MKRAPQVRADRLGFDVREDRGDPGLARRNGPKGALGRSARVLEVLAWLWRRYERDFALRKGAGPGDENRARWTPRHEHELLLFRAGCGDDRDEEPALPQDISFRSRLRGVRVYECQREVRPLNLMLNFISARADVVHDLDVKARRTRPAEAVHVGYARYVIVGDDARAAANVSKAAPALERLAVAIRAGAKRGYADVKVLFMRSRLRPPPTSRADEACFAFPELLLAAALLNVPFDLDEMRAMFSILGGSVQGRQRRAGTPTRMFRQRRPRPGLRGLSARRPRRRRVSRIFRNAPAPRRRLVLTQAPSR